MNPCQHCGAVPVTRRVQTQLLGTKPVDLALCDCDFLRCPNKRCRKTLRRVPMNSHRCPHCERVL